MLLCTLEQLGIIVRSVELVGFASQYRLIDPSISSSIAFFSSSRLNNHMKKQHEPQVLKTCDVCSKQVVDLARHMLLHTGYKFRCDFRLDDDTVCGRIFRSSTRLNEHVDISHKNFRKWVCKYCDHAFARSGQMNTHIRAIHLNFKAGCVVPGCSANFSAKKSMSAHLKMVHKNLTENEYKIYSAKIRAIPLPKVE